MTYDPVARFRHHETQTGGRDADEDEIDAFVDPDDDEDCRAGLVDLYDLDDEI